MSLQPTSPIKPSISPLRFVWNVLRNVVIACIDSYATTMILLMAGRVLIGERWVVIAFFNTFLHLGWLPAMLLFPLMTLLRQRRTSLLLLPSVIAFLITYSGQFIPRTVATPPASIPFTLLDYNLLAQEGDNHARLEIIRTVNADIVTIQEVSTTVAEHLENDFIEQYPYRAVHPNGFAGQAFLSRYPILEERYWRSDIPPNPLGYQRIVISINETPLTIYNVHPTHPGMGGSGKFFDPTYRNLEIQELLRQLAQEEGRILFVGDFNMGELSDDYAAITAHFQDAYRAVGWGLGWTFPLVPFIRLDYAFYNDGLLPLSAQVWHTSGGSDHRPLVIQFALH